MSNPLPRKSIPAVAVAVLLGLTLGPALAHHRHEDASTKAVGTAAAKPAAPAANPAPAPAAPASSTDIPDYGGRDTLVSPSDGAGGDAPSSPLTQAWRALQALVVVLVLVVAALYVIKKYNLIKEGAFQPAAGAKPAGVTGLLLSSWQGFMRTLAQSPTASRSTLSDPTTRLSVLSSTSLPGGAPASVHLIEVAGRRFLVGATGGGMTLLSDWESEPVDEAIEAAASTEGVRFESYLNDMGLTAQTPPEVVGERVSQTTDRLEALLQRARQEAAE